MKMKLILSAIVCFCLAFTAQAQEENVKYQEIDGNHYKFTYYENEVVKSKETVRKEVDNTYTSLDFYELYNIDGDLVFKGNKVKGRHVEYYPSGEKKVHGAIALGKKHGRWSYYTKNNDIIKVEVYNLGELENTVDY